MKKTRLTSVLVAVLMLLMAVLTACGPAVVPFDYASADFSQYIKNAEAGYTGYNVNVKVVNVPDSVDDKEVKDYIKAVLYENKKASDEKGTVIAEHDEVVYYMQGYLTDKDGNRTLATYKQNDTTYTLDAYSNALTSYSSKKFAETYKVNIGHEADKSLGAMIADSIKGLDTKDLILIQKDGKEDQEDANKNKIGLTDIIYVSYTIAQQGQGDTEGKPGTTQYLTIDLNNCKIDADDASKSVYNLTHTTSSGTTTSTTKVTNDDKVVAAQLLEWLKDNNPKMPIVGGSASFTKSEGLGANAVEKTYAVTVAYAVTPQVHEFQLTMPEDFAIQDLQGEEITFEITFGKAPTHYTVPELDATFVKETLKFNATATEDESVVNEYKQSVLDELAAEAKETNKTVKIQELWKTLFDKIEVTPVESEIEGYMNEAINNAGAYYQYNRQLFSLLYGLNTPEEYIRFQYGAKTDEEMRANVRKEAVDVCKAKMMLYWIAKEEDLAPDDAKYEEWFKVFVDREEEKNKKAHDEQQSSSSSSTTTPEEYEKQTVEDYKEMYGEDLLKQTVLWENLMENLLERNAFVETVEGAESDDDTEEDDTTGDENTGNDGNTDAE